MRRRLAALALTLLAAGCADEDTDADTSASASADPYAGPIATWPAQWTLLLYAANDVADRGLAAAFDQDAEEWRLSLGGSALFRVLVQRDYAWFQEAPGGAGSRASERYGLYRRQVVHPEADPCDGQAAACGAQGLGETDSADPATLSDFLVSGIRRAPARRAWVLVTGHGDGWNGLAFDATSGPRRRMPLSGLRGALDAAAAERGAPIDVVQFDACRMGTVEVAAELAGASHTLVASSATVPDAGHPYSALRWLSQAEPEASTREVVSGLVTDYVRAYVEGVSTQDRAYVGTSVASAALDLRRLPPLLEALSRLGGEVRAERPRGFDCAEVEAIAARAGRAPAADGAQGTLVEKASVDLASLLEALADPAGVSGAAWPGVSAAVAGAAGAARALLGPPREAAARFAGQYRETVGEGPDALLVVEAARKDPGSEVWPGGVGVLWGAPLDLLVKEQGESPLDVYLRLRFEASTGWTGMFEACVAEARACLAGESEEACARVRRFG